MELYERLKVGYSDGSLLKRITEGQKERAESLRSYYLFGKRVP